MGTRNAGWLALGLAVSMLVACVAPLGRSSALAAGGQYFPETQHTLSGPLLTAWQQGGGVWVYGYPISEPFAWATVDGQTVIAQYFERARLEYHPENAGTPYRVLGGLLGVDLAAGREDEAPFQSVVGAPDVGCDYYVESSHSLCGIFQRWWRAQGGLPVFGFPISEPFMEGGYLTQYFERARLEYHPEFAGTQWEVELGQLGMADAARRGLLATPPFGGAVAPTVTTRVALTLASSPGGGDSVGDVPAGARVTVLGGPSADWYQLGYAGATGWAPFGDLNWSVAPDAREASRYTLSSLSVDVARLVAANSSVASVAVYDPNTDRMYVGGQSGPIAGASLSKTLLLAAALQQAEYAGGELDDGERDVLTVMIEDSDNDAANTIWNLIGDAEGMDAFLANNALGGFDVPNEFDWGAVSAEAPAWAAFMELLGSGQLLTPTDTAFALGLMHGVIDDHRWGVLTPGPDRLSIGKNGWYPDETDPYDWRVTGAGFVDSTEGPLGVAPLVVVVLTRYPGERDMGWGVDFANQVQSAVIAGAERRWAATQPEIAGTLPEVSLRDVRLRALTAAARGGPALTSVNLPDD